MSRIAEAKNQFNQQPSDIKNTNIPINDINELHVGFYGRVSKDEESMLRSLKNQKEFFGNWLEQNPNWKLYDIYIDEGITGLNTKKRHGFNRMMHDAKNGCFQIVMIKSISRFGRNMSDTSAALDVFLELGIRVIFVEDNIDSINKQDLEKFGLFAWLAEIESRKISDRVNITFDKMRKEGYYFGSKAPYGYSKKDGKLYINLEESKIVEKIYNLYLSGYGTSKIAITLTKENIPAPIANRWNDMHIKRTLTNPCYIGNTYTNQSKTIDIKSRKRATNNFNEWILFENSHQAIISKDIFEQVQVEFEKRKNDYLKKSRQSTKHLFSNIVKCGRCGSSYMRKERYDKIKATPRWTCWNYDKYGTTACVSERISEDNLTDILIDIFKSFKDNKKELTEIVNNEKDFLFKNKKYYKDELKIQESKKDVLLKKMAKLLDLYTEDEITKKEYIDRTNPIGKDIDVINKELNNIQKKLIEDNDIDKRLQDFIDELDDMCNVENWSNIRLKKHIYAIIVYDRNTIEVILQLQRNAYEFNSTYLSTPTVVGVWKGVRHTKSLDFKCLECQNVVMSTNTLELKINDYPIKVFNNEDENELRLSILINKKEGEINEV